MPDITGSIGAKTLTSAEKGLVNGGGGDGAFTGLIHTKRGFTTSSDKFSHAIGYLFNASLSNSIYGNSNTVTPETIKTLMAIKYI